MAFIVERDSQSRTGRPRPSAATDTLTQRMYRTADLLHVLTWAVGGLVVIELFTIGAAAVHQSGAEDLALLAILVALAKGAGIILVLRAVAFLLTDAADQRPAALDAVARPPGGVGLGFHCSNCDAGVEPRASRCPTCGIEFDAPPDAQPAT